MYANPSLSVDANPARGLGFSVWSAHVAEVRRIQLATTVHHLVVDTDVGNDDHVSDAWEFDAFGRHKAPSPHQLDLPFDAAELDVAEMGSLIVLRYRGRFGICTRRTSGEIDGIECDDEVLATIAAGLGGRRTT